MTWRARKVASALARLCRLGTSLIGAALLMAGAAGAQAPVSLRLARVENIADQLVGSAILEVVYRRLDIAVEFVDMPAKRALVESSQGHVDGEVQRVLDVGREYPTLLPVLPSINYIEPAVFVKGLDLRITGWSSIAPYSIGIVRGVGSSERGTKGMAGVVAVNSMDQMMDMLANDRIEVAVSDRFSGLLGREAAPSGVDGAAASARAGAHRAVPLPQRTPSAPDSAREQGHRVDGRQRRARATA